MIVIELWYSIISICDRFGQVWLPSDFIGTACLELALFAISFMLAVLLFIKYFGLSSRLRRYRERLMGLAYQILLYRRRPWLVITSELRLLGANVAYLLALIPTLVFSGILFLLMFNTLDNRYGYAPATLGEPHVIKTSPLINTDIKLSNYILRTDNSDIQITARVHAPGINAIWSRLEASRGDLFRLNIGHMESHNVLLNVDRADAPAMPRQIANEFAIEIAYLPSQWWGMPHGWLMYFLAACLLVSMPIARLLKLRL